MIKNLTILLALILLSTCEIGADLSTLTSVDAFKCLLQNQTFLNVRAWRSFGAFDSNSIQTLANAKTAGYKIENLGVYMFPCMSPNKPASDQVNSMVEALKNSEYSGLWIDMETNTNPGCGWTKDYDANCQFTEQLVNAAKKSGKNVGIYASHYMWTQIFGSTTFCSKFSYLPLWYAHYDHNPSFDDFQEFGGWTKPSVKQFQGTTAICNASIDFNYRQ